MKIKQVLLILSVLNLFFLRAQDPFSYEEKPFYIGVGAGIDFGRAGLKAEYMFLDYAGVFLGAGVHLRFRIVVINGGLLIKPLPRKLFTPYFSGMYGLNSFIHWGQSNKTEVHYNFSLGTGFEFRTRNLNKWQFGVIMPIRSDDFVQYYESLQNSSSVSLSGRLQPILISIGVKFIM